MVNDIDHSTANQDGKKEEEKLHPPALLVASCWKLDVNMHQNSRSILTVKDEYRQNCWEICRKSKKEQSFSNAHTRDTRNHPVHNGGEGSVLAVLMENKAVLLSPLSTRAKGADLHLHHQQEKGEWNYKQQRIEDFISKGCRFIVCGYWWIRKVSFFRKWLQNAGLIYDAPLLVFWELYERGALSRLWAAFPLVRHGRRQETLLLLRARYFVTTNKFVDQLKFNHEHEQRTFRIT